MKWWTTTPRMPKESDTGFWAFMDLAFVGGVIVVGSVLVRRTVRGMSNKP